MDTDNLIGQAYSRPGSEDAGDRWEIISIRRDEHGPLVVLQSGDGETVTVSLSHLREPYWRPVECPDPPEFD